MLYLETMIPHLLITINKKSTKDNYKGHKLLAFKTGLSLWWFRFNLTTRYYFPLSFRGSCCLWEVRKIRPCFPQPPSSLAQLLQLPFQKHKICQVGLHSYMKIPQWKNFWKVASDTL